MKDLFNSGSIKETKRYLVNKLFIYESVASYKSSSHCFKNMKIGAQ